MPSVGSGRYSPGPNMRGSSLQTRVEPQYKPKNTANSRPNPAQILQSPPEPTRGAGSPRTWRPVTPAMAASLPDHVWTTGELLAYRVPVEFLDQLRTIEHLFPEWNVVHHSNCSPFAL